MKQKLKFKVIADYPYSPHKIGDIVNIGSNPELAKEYMKYPNFFLLIEEEDEVTHGEFFGENIRRVKKILYTRK